MGTLILCLNVHNCFSVFALVSLPSTCSFSKYEYFRNLVDQRGKLKGKSSRTLMKLLPPDPEWPEVLERSGYHSCRIFWGPVVHSSMTCQKQHLQHSELGMCGHLMSILPVSRVSSQRRVEKKAKQSQKPCTGTVWMHSLSLYLYLSLSLSLISDATCNCFVLSNAESSAIPLCCTGKCCTISCEWHVHEGPKLFLQQLCDQYSCDCWLTACWVVMQASRSLGRRECNEMAKQKQAILTLSKSTLYKDHSRSCNYIHGRALRKFHKCSEWIQKWILQILIVKRFWTFRAVLSNYVHGDTIFVSNSSQRM